MAYHQPALQVSQKRTSAASEGLYIQLDQSKQHQSSRQRRQPSDSQEWVLFEPASAGTVDRSNKSSTARTFTVGCSQISDIGSLESGVWSCDNGEEYLEVENENDKEYEELDSLDSQLLEFRTEPSACGLKPEPYESVLPTHDGLGSFRLGHTTMNIDVQQYLYKFERFNPHRIKRQKECMEQGMPELEPGEVEDTDWLRRIEVWRLEQSRVLVDEIERESRKNRQDIRKKRKNTKEELTKETVATLGDSINEATTDDNESLWNRITLKFIQDLIGIDENLLSIIFGESFVCDLEQSSTKLSHQPNLSRSYNQTPWEFKFLERIAYELENLASRFSHHPERLNTYLHPPNISISYAGLPMISELKNSQILSSNKSKIDSSIISRSSDPEFYPTIESQAYPSNLNSSPISQNTDEGDATPYVGKRVKGELTRDEWERDLDLKLVFRYIFDRVASKFSSTRNSHLNSIDNTNQRTKLETVDTAARDACVRRHHPLISGRSSIKKNPLSYNRTWAVSVPAGSGVSGVNNPRMIGINFSIQKKNSRGSDSHDSEREKVICSGSSKNYWDWADSVGSGKTTLGTGAMGSWGEV